MTTLYLDTEFNGWQGQLISLALYDPRELTVGFYAVLGGLKAADIDPWVEVNVIPVLSVKEFFTYEKFQRRLVEFLSAKGKPLEVYADWPADLEHLFRALNTGAPWRVDIPLTAHLIESPALVSAIPHNAWEDAKALGEWHQWSLKPSITTQ